MQQPAHYADTFLPDFCEQGNLLRTMLIAELLAIAVAAVEGGTWLVHLETLALASLLVQWVAIVDIALLCSAQRYLARLDDRIAAALAFVVLQGVTLGFTALVEIGQELLTVPLTYRPFPTMVSEHLVISSIVTAVALRYFYVTAQWRRNVEAAAEARIEALQARIRPHFLFNSMNTIAQLTRTEPAQAEAAVEDLSELFRISLSQRSIIRLDEELAMVGSYLRLERLRLGDRLGVEWSVASGTGAAGVPALTLQPLVENAVYHGVARLPQGGRIAITVRPEAEARIGITIRNPVPQGTAEAGGHRMAQENVGERLRLALGERAAMTSSTEGDDYVVRLTIPAEGVS